MQVGHGIISLSNCENCVQSFVRDLWHNLLTARDRGVAGDLERQSYPQLTT